ncbi:unnamed protein product [Chrysoparadoxa australica]
MSHVSDEAILKGVHREIDLFLDGRLHDIVPTYERPEVREQKLREELAALKQDLRLGLGGRKRARYEVDDSSRMEVERLKRKVQELEAVSERDVQSHRHEVEELESAKAKLERHVKYLLTEEQAAREELEERAGAWKREREEGLNRLKRGREEVLELKQEVEQLRWASRSNANKDRVDAMETDRAANDAELISALRASAETSSRLAARARSEAAEAKDKALHAENALQELRAASAAMGKSDMGDTGFELRAQVRKLESAMDKKTKECEMLEGEVKRSAHLDEQMENLKAQLKRKQEMLTSAVKEKTESDAIIQEKRDWESFFASLLRDSLPEGAVATPMTVMKMLKVSQMKEAALTAREAELTARVRALQGECRTKDAAANASAVHAATLQQELGQLKQTVQMGRARLATLTADLKAKNELIRSYEEDPRRSEASTSAYAALEAALKTAKNEIDTLRTQPVPAVAETDTKPAAVAVLQEQLEGMEKERNQAIKALEKAEADLAVYERQLGAGDYDKTKTKVLHFGLNPSTLAAQRRSKDAQVRELALLREENARLKEGMPVAAAAAAPGSDRRGSVGEVDKDKINTRLKEMFKERIKFFREAVYLLTGFKIDMTTDREHPQLRLRSMFAENEEDHLLFRWGDDGLELMETPFAAMLDRKIFTYLSTCNSIPAFLSNLTLELFEKV